MQQILDLVRGLLNNVVRWKPSNGFEATRGKWTLCQWVIFLVLCFLGKRPGWVHGQENSSTYLKRPEKKTKEKYHDIKRIHISKKEKQF